MQCGRSRCCGVRARLLHSSAGRMAAAFAVVYVCLAPETHLSRCHFFTDPWEHVALAGLGGFAGAAVVKWEVWFFEYLLHFGLVDGDGAGDLLQLWWCEQERTLKEVAEMEKVRAKRYLGACTLFHNGPPLTDTLLGPTL